jgi:hypothetical protein
MTILLGKPSFFKFFIRFILRSESVLYSFILLVVDNLANKRHQKEYLVSIIWQDEMSYMYTGYSFYARMDIIKGILLGGHFGTLCINQAFSGWNYYAIL